MKIILFIAFCIICLNTYGQDKVIVIATGRSISRDLTPEQAKEKAINDARLNACRQAGVSEYISVIQILTTSQKTSIQKVKYYNQEFDKIVTSETKAEIIMDSVIYEASNFDENRNMEILVKVQFTIFKHNHEIDRNFIFKLEGLNDYYNTSDEIVFNFTPSQNGFLKIFNIPENENETVILYPYNDKERAYLNDDPNKLFISNQTITFPTNPNVRDYSGGGYTLSISKTENNTECDHMIFVYTKENIPYTGDLNLRNILRWIYNIPIDQRFIQHKAITIIRAI